MGFEGIYAGQGHVGMCNFSGLGRGELGRNWHGGYGVERRLSSGGESEAVLTADGLARTNVAVLLY